jgi:hypothetical protein
MGFCKIDPRSKMFQYEEKYLVRPRPSSFRLASTVYTARERQAFEADRE